MKVFKFGGASVKDAEGVINLSEILKNYLNEKVVVVVSAMGKTTNALEKLTHAYYYNRKDEMLSHFSLVKDYHFNILLKLFPKKHKIYSEIEYLFKKLCEYLEKQPSENYDFEYDQIVHYGELFSTKIVAEFLIKEGINCEWIDARKIIKTDNNYREGKINWKKTISNIRETILPLLEKGILPLTQGFIGMSSDGFAITLGREGSDYTAAIISYSIDAESVTIWKDVPGILNADPKWFSNTVKIDHLSYIDAIELAYYGATVIHPKTIQPLQNKKIPLYVKSFLNPNEPGTIINYEDVKLKIPSFIFKVNQVLITISPKDFSFIIEENLRDIFDIFSRHKIHINVMQNSALSFTVCVDFDEIKIPDLLLSLKSSFKVKFNSNLELVTIRHYDEETINRVCENKEIFLIQKSRNTVQIVVKDKS